ncbi:homoserine O- acetyltransferase [Physocladia obscura]|uniref:Homoserine O- acetyltransferase n=1 Tax=Physocladia obscura TaxID=109957 RepID=A0AAD5T156_9FUNG|nr:homoserine O- acetyltransferase [Physocladia obscura]
MTNFAELIQGQTIHILDYIELEISGNKLKNVPIAYKTWGTLNSAGTNAMVICHALSGSTDVDDWWGPLLGPGKAFDTDVFFIFCANVLGSPYGSASPVTINPETGRPYGPDFPLTTIRDDVRAHKQVLDALGVKEVQYVIGGSMGGMQVLEWSFFGIEYVKNIAAIATSGRYSAWCISWGEQQRQTIYSDPNYQNGFYDMTNPPKQGLSAARMSALMTYRSRNSFESRFGRKTMTFKDGGADDVPLNSFHRANDAQNSVDPSNSSGPKVFSVQSYLRYQGEKFVARFDANCYVAITRKLDTHDISRARGKYEQVLESIEQNTLIVGIETDGLFTISEQYELSEHIPNSEIIIVHSFEGHDGFLLEFEQMNKHLTAFIRKHTPDLVSRISSGGEFKIGEKKSLFGEAEGTDALMLFEGNPRPSVTHITNLMLDIAQCGFWQNHAAMEKVLNLNELMDQNSETRAVSMDIQAAYDCANPELM